MIQRDTPYGAFNFQVDLGTGALNRHFQAIVYFHQQVAIVAFGPTRLHLDLRQLGCRKRGFLELIAAGKRGPCPRKALECQTTGQYQQ